MKTAISVPTVTSACRLAIDTVPERLRLARDAGAVTIDFRNEDVYDRIQELTHGRGRMRWAV